MINLFDVTVRTDTSRKKLREPVFHYWNRSARSSPVEVRSLINDFLSRVPAPPAEGFHSRFRCNDDFECASAFQELLLHELLLRHKCQVRFHVPAPGSTKCPDFLVTEPDGATFALEACTSTKIFSAPLPNPRRERILDFLHEFVLDDYILGVEEIIAGKNDFRRRTLKGHILDSLKNVQNSGSLAGPIPLPPIESSDGWQIRLTARPKAGFKPANGVMYEGCRHTWTGPSDQLLRILKNKGGRYGDLRELPFVIAFNTFDPLVWNAEFEESLFGMGGFWGTALHPQYKRVSAVLFTKNLWPETVLLNETSPRLYLNPWADRPYHGALTKFDTVRLRDGLRRCEAGESLPQRLGITPADGPSWGHGPQAEELSWASVWALVEGHSD